MGNLATSTFISSPAEAFKDLAAWDELYKTLPKVFWFNTVLAANVTEILPGELVGVMGRTGNGKTSFLLAQAYHQAKRLRAEQEELTNAVCYFTWDQPKEKLEQRLRRAMVADGEPYHLTQRMALPLWFVGKGLMDARENGHARMPLTVEVVEQTLNEIMKWDKKPSLLLVDYLQRIPARSGDDKMNQVMRVSNALSDFAAEYNVPVIVGTQATRDTDKQLDKTPALGGSRWSAEFEDMVDKLIALWRPSTSEKPGTPIDVNGKPYMTDEKLMKCTKWKDREGAANVSFAFPFDMVTLKAGDYE
jgi:replicative DNA helicase